MPENFVRKTGPVAPEIPDFNADDLADESVNDPFFDPNSYIIEKEVVADEALNKPRLTREDFTPEAIAKARNLAGRGHLNNEDLGLPHITGDTVTETIEMDEVLKPIPVVIEPTFPRLTREDFSEQAIMAKKLAAQANAKPAVGTPSSFTRFKESDVEKIDMTDALSKPRLTRNDFTPEGIARARKLAQGESPESINRLPDHLKIEDNLRVPNQAPSKQGFSPTIPNNNVRTIPTNKIAEGVPETIYKIKPEPAPAKKGFFSRLVPKFISRFF